MRKIRVLDNVYDLITINMEDRFKDNVAFRFYDTANDADRKSTRLNSSH